MRISMAAIALAVVVSACSQPDPYENVPYAVSCPLKWDRVKHALEIAAIHQGDFSALNSIDHYIERNKDRCPNAQHQSS